jgi:hypothetical protein
MTHDKKDMAGLREFIRECVQAAFEGHGVDGGEIQDMAVKHGILRQVEFNPAIHTDSTGYSEKGDPWFVYTDEFKADADLLDRVAVLEKALEPFASVADLIDSEMTGVDPHDECALMFHDYLMENFSVAEFQDARTALRTGDASS